MTFSSTSRLIPLFNLFSSLESRVCESSPTSSYFHSPPPSPWLTLAPAPSPPDRQMSARTHPLQRTVFCFSFFLSFPFLAVFPSPGVYFSPPCSSVFVRRSLDFSMTLSLSLPPRSFASARSLFPVICFASARRPSSSSAPLSSATLSSDSSWRLSSLDCCGPVARLCVQYRVACKDEELNKLLKAVTCRCCRRTRLRIPVCTRLAEPLLPLYTHRWYTYKHG